MLAATTRSRALLFIINPWNVTDSSEVLLSPHLCPPLTLQIYQGLRSLYDSDPGFKSHSGLERITHLSLFCVHCTSKCLWWAPYPQCPSEAKGQKKPMLWCKVPRDWGLFLSVHGCWLSRLRSAIWLETPFQRNSHCGLAFRIDIRSLCYSQNPLAFLTLWCTFCFFYSERTHAWFQKE